MVPHAIVGDYVFEIVADRCLRPRGRDASLHQI